MGKVKSGKLNTVHVEMIAREAAPRTKATDHLYLLGRLDVSGIQDKQCVPVPRRVDMLGRLPIDQSPHNGPSHQRQRPYHLQTQPKPSHWLVLGSCRSDLMIDYRSWGIESLAPLADSVAKPYSEAFVTAARTASGCFHPEDEREHQVPRI